MCVPDLSVLKSSVLGDKQYILGAIVARRLHHNGISGDLFGGIYATCVSNYLNVPIHGNDIELPPAYLDYNAMVLHQFLERNEQFLQYRLIFDIQRTVHVALPAPTFFNFQAKRRYVITKEYGGSSPPSCSFTSSSFCISIRPQLQLWTSTRPAVAIDQLRPKF